MFFSAAPRPYSCGPDKRRPRRPVLSAVVALLLAVIGAGCTPAKETPDAPDRSSASPGPGAPSPSASEPWRPAAHLTTSRNWMNDPNGLVYENGTYHAFYQYNPKGNDWGNMSWGHSTSTDLVHWTEEPVAMEATDMEEIFSGSIVMDTEDRSGLGSKEAPAMVALYTSAYKDNAPLPKGSQAQSLAYSLDHGHTWKKHQGNPVVNLEPASPNFRDPKVTWYEPGQYWVMTTVVADAHVVKLYKSTDLLHWDFLSDFSGVGAQGGLWEMPELLEVPVEGTNERRWVMLLSINPGGIAGGSGMQYFSGDFDGVTFRAEGAAGPEAPLQDHQWVDYGADFYAATTISGAPGGKPVLFGWMGNWDYAQKIPTTPWRGTMAVPRELTLSSNTSITSADGGRAALRSSIAAVPAAELSGGRPYEQRMQLNDGSQPLGQDFSSRSQLLDVELTPDTATEAGIVLRGAESPSADGSAEGQQGLRISYRAQSGSLTIDRSAAGTSNFSDKFSPYQQVSVPLTDGKLKLRILLDSSSVEVFAPDSGTVITDLFLPAWADTGASVFSEGGNARFTVTGRNIPG
ncbi:glycoside hydrolase family 32 protein [Arthrobacter sp. ISL-48]|uniref:glycoside hydrolase family 32 protein n=1 Tax=Arthrobacter sp. ISL-48 TaxID=2819110 RepID=UPI001BE72D95|nr:glycoside hydrolase family 32 protein [Arthrobacter sp. ISL-48]MBT2531117.1 glycoside hydrolase family 32 protein [Arthrobacter sp. ISL-48]